MTPLRSYSYKSGLTWKLKTLLDAARHPFKFKPFFGDSLKGFYVEQKKQKEQKLPILSLSSFIDPTLPIHLLNYMTQGANVSHLELLCLCSSIAQTKPKKLLEIGTYDGNTTLQMGMNTTEDAVIHTIDLPNEQLDFIPKKRRFIDTHVEKKIHQHYGDTKNYSFSNFAKDGPTQWIFIDGDHHYAYVKRDTEKAMEILAPGGILFWHDYTPNIPGVFQFLNEFVESFPIKQIEGTSLAFYQHIG